MKVCITSWAPFVAGAEVAAERLALGLAEAGHRVLMIVGTDGDALIRFRDAGIRCQYVPQRFTDKLKWLQYRNSRARMQQILRDEQPDLVHSNDLPTHQLTSDAARRLGIPRICHHRWIFDRGAIDWMNKFGAQRHLFVSDALMTMLCDASPSLAAAPRSVVYDGLPIPQMPGPAERPKAKAALGLDPQRCCVLFAGQIIERKGVADLLHAWDRLAPQTRQSAQLVVVGDDLEQGGAYRAQMQQLAESLGHPVHFAGFQRNVPRWLTAADLVLVPSHAEPLGNATLEAMAHGRAVIGSRVGGIPEMIDDGRSGLLIPPHSPEALAAAITRLVADSLWCDSLGAEARRQCQQRFSLQAHVESVTAEYHLVLNSSGIVDSCR